MPRRITFDLDYLVLDPDSAELLEDHLIAAFVNHLLSRLLDVGVQCGLHRVEVVLADGAQVGQPPLFALLQVPSDVAEVHVRLQVAVGVHEELGADLRVQNLVLIHPAVGPVVLLHQV